MVEPHVKDQIILDRSKTGLSLKIRGNNEVEITK